MKLKKIIAIITAFTMLVVFAACGNAEAEESVQESNTEFYNEAVTDEETASDEIKTDESESNPNSEKDTESPKPSIGSTEKVSDTKKPISDNKNPTKPIQTPTEKPTERPTEKPTKPVEKPSEKPTVPPTEKPTEDILTFEEVGVERFTKDMREYAESIGLIWDPEMNPENSSWACPLRFDPEQDYNERFTNVIKRDIRSVKDRECKFINFYCRIENGKYVLYELYA